MSRFVVSFSKEETEAALAYYSSHASQLPPFVSVFFQTLLAQVSQAENNPQGRNNLLASTDIQNTANFPITTVDFRQGTSSFSPYLPTPSPPRTFREKGGSQASNSFQTIVQTPSDLYQASPTTDLTQRGGLYLPTPSPSPPRTFLESDSVLSEKARLPS
ncbi:hypothetical protein FB446DRAFT_795491, partial [Lentinula raphanica]